MREIKFRLYRKTSKEMISWEKLCKNPFELSILKDNEENERWSSFMQYTGLKDSKGNEIYEGDILKGPTLYETPENHSTTYSYWDVAYKNSSFYLGDSAIEEDFDWILEECEVVGNIYENKNLLDGGKGE